MIEFSVIIPLYNRPQELKELLSSLNEIESDGFEVIVVEDGSIIKSDHIINEFSDSLNLKYISQDNTGPGGARNHGASLANKDWLIFFDSDCIIPGAYFDSVSSALQQNDLDMFGGPDRARSDFTAIQKAINYSMTSFLTTGGIRGKKSSLENFKPRSFNMGIKRTLFEKVGGFSNLRFGEDLDLTLRLEKNDARSMLIEDAYVYHKRRTNFRQFYKQVFNSGIARIVLNSLHPGTLKMVHLLPFLFIAFHFVLVFVSMFFLPASVFTILLFPAIFFFDALIKERNFKTALLAPIASYTQLFGYGLGFFKAAVDHYIFRKELKYAFRDSFYS
ncbi:MAG: glycosyltransferase [Bacteroidota bacterium]